ncbi:MAG: tRNA glutamyl-Q(34) synthetase GluQRS [Parvibaculaceae bacterium]
MPWPTFRFAPSPNGALHLGHAYSALFTDAAARKAEGWFLLRLEDIDVVRCTDALVRDCLFDLGWLGLSWEEPVRRQSAHMADYQAALRRLDAMGLLYPCTCSRQDILRAAGPDAPRDPDGTPLYPGTCKGRRESERKAVIGGGAGYALRLDLEKAMPFGPSLWFEEDGEGPDGEKGRIEAVPLRWGDVVLARKDIGTSYHIAVVTDDALQGITHVTRGQDLFHATGLHRLLQALLNLPEPRYHHHRLIGDETGRKLSKSEGAPSLRSLREQGLTPATIRRELGFIALP